MANKKVEEIEGIGPAYAEKLRAAGVADTDTLLKKGCTKRGRESMAAECGIGESTLLKWVNMADLFRIKGVGGEYAELLEAAGVDTVKELAARNAVNLAEKMAEVNEKKKLTRRVPSDKVVQGWIDEAKGLPQLVQH